MRVILGLLLSLILAMSSGIEAVARSEMAGAQAQELCGTGSVLIDVTGKPLTAHPCTHCLAASVAAVLGVAPVLARPQTRASAVVAAVQSLAQSQPVTEALARGPPQPV